jgi:carboxylate-amine ligase
MLLDPRTWSLDSRSDEVLAALPEEMQGRTAAETHGSALELATRPHHDVAAAAGELCALRGGLAAALEPLGIRAAVAGTHPFARWEDVEVSPGARYQFLYSSMRELARREPTFGLHVHVAVPNPEQAVRAYNRVRAHLPMLLALSGNSPFWQGRDTGLASARTPLFQAFPRVGIPRAFASYDEYVSTVDLLIRCEAFPEPTFLWWDVRPQPRFGTVEVRIMDTQTTVAATAALVALVQSLAKLECEEEFASDDLLASPEVLSENRFLAARDGAKAALVDPVSERRVPVVELLTDVLAAARPHARELGCEDELMHVHALVERPAAARQLWFARRAKRLPGLVEELAASFTA